MKLILHCSLLLLLAAAKASACPVPADSSIHKADSTLNAVSALPDKYYKQVDAKTRKMAATVNKRSLDAVNSMLDKEKKMQAKLTQTDSLAATRIFQHSIDSLQHLQSLLKSKIAFANKAISYNGYVDSLTNTLSFIKQLKGGLGSQKSLDGAMSQA